MLETGIDASCFASRTELLPQLPSLKTVHRTVFLTLRPKGSIPSPQKERESLGETLSFLVLETGIEPATY